MHPWAQWVTAPVAHRPELFNAFTNPDLLEFDSRDGRIGLRATLRFTYCDDDRHLGERKVATGDYGYTLTGPEGQEMLSWQWHPSVGEYDMPPPPCGTRPTGLLREDAHPDRTRRL